MKSWNVTLTLPGAGTENVGVIIHNTLKGAKAEASRLTKQTGKWVDMTPNDDPTKETHVKMIDGGGQLILRLNADYSN